MIEFVQQQRYVDALDDWKQELFPKHKLNFEVAGQRYEYFSRAVFDAECLANKGLVGKVTNVVTGDTRVYWREVGKAGVHSAWLDNELAEYLRKLGFDL